MSARNNVVQFPSRRETFERILSELSKLRDRVQCASAIVCVDGLCYVYTFNMTAEGLAFHALNLQKEALFDGGLLVEPEGE